MKTLGRVLIILTVFAIVMGVIYFAVNASGSSTNASAFENGSAKFAPNGERPEFEGERSGGIGLIFGLMKNVIIVALLVAMVVFPKNIMQQRRKAVPVKVR